MRLFKYIILLALYCSCQAASSDKRKSIEKKDRAVEATQVDPGESKSSELKRYKWKRGPVELQLLGLNYPKQSFVYVYETEGTDMFKIDSLKNEGDRFTGTLQSIIPGIYKIGDSSKNDLAEVILNPREESIIFNFQNSPIKRGNFQTKSIENQLFLAYQKEKAQHDKSISSIKKQKVERSQKLKSIYAEQDRFKVYQDKVASENEGTYFANMVSHLQSPQRYNKSAYWNDIDFTDETLIHSLVFHERIQDYMRLHASKEKSKSEPRLGFYNAVDRIAQIIKENGNDRVLEFVLYSLSEGFYSSGMEELSLYVVDNYFYGDGCGDAEISELFKMKASGVRQLQVGQVPPNIKRLDFKNNSFDLYSFSSGNELSLVLFWASFCHKCEREVPELLKLYSHYRSRGFDVCAVSVDTNRPSWQKGINQHNIGGWHNVSDLEGWRGKIAKDYRVSSTPVMFLIDKESKIVARPQTVEELKSYLQKGL